MFLGLCTYLASWMLVYLSAFTHLRLSYPVSYRLLYNIEPSLTILYFYGMRRARSPWLALCISYFINLGLTVYE